MNNIRETAWRVFATELNSASYEIKAEEEMKPSYQLSRLGAPINRVLVAGVLTEKEDIGTDGEPMWRGRIQDPAGGFVFINVGRFQPDAAATMAEVEVPSRIAVIGKVKSYNAEDGKVLISVRPERIVVIDDKVQNEWLLDTANSTWKRLKDMKRALSLSDRSEQGLISAGFAEISARGISKAIEEYGVPNSEAYLKAIQKALRLLLPDKNIDMGFPEDLAEAPEEIEIDNDSTEQSEDKEEIILQLLEQLDTDGKGAPRDVLEEEMSKRGITPMELEAISNTLLDKGIVYEPNLRYLKRI